MGAGNHAEEVPEKGIVGRLTKVEVPNQRSPNLEGFNETEYIKSARKDKDSYRLNAFNQAESDKLHSDRSIPDSRHHRLVMSGVGVV